MKKDNLNIMFSTTRQWNPGDEFILLGTINLLKKYLSKDINCIIYNRNPQIRVAYGKRELYKIIGNINLFSNFKDNSIHINMDNKFIDLAVFAGSPEWFGKRSKDFYKICIENNIKTLAMGIGLGGKTIHLKDYEKEILMKSEFISVRDKFTEKFLANFKAKFIPCPALFSSIKSKEVKEVKKIALTYACFDTVRANNINLKAYNYMKDLYNLIIENYGDNIEIEFVAHYIEELPKFYNDFKNHKIRYSYDSKDYLDIYNDYDLVIGTRVHGIGISASLGVPGIMIAHDGRSETVKGFLAEIINVNDKLEKALELIEKTIINVNEKSKSLIKHKMKVEELYKENIEKIKERI